MEMNWKLRKVLALVLLLSLTVGLFMPAAAVAADPPGWLYIKLGDHDVINNYLKDGNTVEMSIYQVAKSNGNGGWVVNTPFIGFADDIKTAELRLRVGDDGMIQTILNDSKFRDQVLKSEAYKTEPLNDEHEFLFTYLESGIYYAIMTKGPEGLLVQSPLVPIPYRPNGTNSELFSLSVGAKVLEYYPLTAVKRMAGRDFYPGDKFTFELIASAGAPLPKDAAGNDVTKVTITPTSGREATVDFGKLVFTQANAGNTYTYTIIEKDEGEKNFAEQYIMPDTTAKRVTVTVEDAGGGKLTVTGLDNDNPPVLTNTYDFTASIPLNAFKELIGREFQEGDKWTFTAVKVEDNAPPIKKAEDANSANASGTTPDLPAGQFVSDPILLGYLHFDENNIGKTYHYRITESGEGKGVTNDPASTKTVEVKVTYNPETRKIEVVSSSGDQSDYIKPLTDEEFQAKSDSVTFKNIYNANGEYTFKGKKNVENLKALERALQPNEFSFTIKEVVQQGDKQVEEDVFPEPASNDAEGNIVYPAIQFTLADVGDHIYKVSEINDIFDELIEGDETTHTVRLRVSDNKDGTLKVTPLKTVGNSSYDNPAKLDFTNKVLTGNLRVSKKIESPVSESSEFPFTVEMVRGDGKPINGTFGDVTFTDGKATFTLTQGGSKLISGVPIGTVYTVKEEMPEEQQKLYALSDIKQQLITTSGRVESGTIEKENALAGGSIVTGTIVADYTNERNLGNLTIVKKLEEENQLEEDLDKEFTFTVTMADNKVLIKGSDIKYVTEDGEQQYTSDTIKAESNYQGSVTVKTKADTPVVIKNLPVGVDYTITEKEVPFFALTGKTNDTGAISQEGITATLTNKRDVKPVSLTVTKTVQSTTTDTTSFNFTVTLNEWNGMKLTGKFGDMDFTDGVATFKLKSGESKTATGLPSGIRYTVTEAEIANYVQTQATGVSGTIDADAPLGADRVAAFTNTRVTTPTGGGGGGGGGGGTRPNPTTTPAPTVPPEPGEPTPTPADETITVAGRKTWDDNNNAAGRRPDSITIHLFADSAAAVEEVASRVVTEADGWAWTFTDLPVVDSYNLPIDYSIVEDPVPGYTTTYSGYDVINSLPTELTSATVIKNWDDGDDENHLMRPTSLRATLYGDNNVVSTVILNEGNGWSATVDELPVYRDGSRIAYTWREEEALGYVQTGIETDGTVTTITNTLWQLVPPPDGTNPGPRPGNPEDEIDDYGTPLGLGIIINHVGDCFD